MTFFLFCDCKRLRFACSPPKTQLLTQLGIHSSSCCCWSESQDHTAHYNILFAIRLNQ